MLLLLVLCALIAFTSGFRSVCYYTNWSQYRPGKGTFVPENVDALLCSHLMYAFAKPVGLNIEAFEWNDDSTQWSEGMYSRTMKLKVKNPALKIILALGGYNMGSAPFVPIVESASTRATFAQNAIKFLRDRSFDGLDVDWEYPATGVSPPEDKEKYALLMQELRRAFDVETLTGGKSRLILTAALPAGKNNIDAGFDVPTIMKYMDFASIMTYDLHGSWEPYTGINSPLFANTKDTGTDAYLNLHWAAQYYISLGAPPEKLNIGIALYGRSFTLDNPNLNDIGSPASQPGEAGQFTGEKGFLAYYEICDLIFSDAHVVDVPSQRNRYLYKGQLWVGYDDRQSVTEKACYAKQNGFGGLMFWSPDLDDFSGQTCKQGTYPLIRTAKTEMGSTTFENCVQPSDISNITFTTQQPIVTSPQTSKPVTPSMILTHEFDCTRKPDDFYQDPVSCGLFFICANGVAYLAHCGGGFFFNPQTKHCESDKFSICNTYPTTTPSTVATTQPSTTQTTTAANQICVGQPNGTIGHPTDCHKFFLCNEQSAMELDCQGSMVFNPALGACDFSACDKQIVVG